MLVRVRNPEHARPSVWRFEQPEYYEYSGEEVKVKHVTADELALTTGLAEWPVRVIQRGLIISIDGQEYHWHRGTEPTQTKIVLGSRGQEYEVTNSQGRWSCTCPGFTFRKSCRHTSA